jgi:hypothetical protein
MAKTSFRVVEDLLIKTFFFGDLVGAGGSISLRLIPPTNGKFVDFLRNFAILLTELS